MAAAPIAHGVLRQSLHAVGKHRARTAKMPKTVKPRANSLIDAIANVNGDSNADKGTDNKNNNLD